MGWRTNTTEDARARASRLWQAHRGFASVVLMVHRPRGAELSDLLQEVALRVHRNIGALRDEGAAPGWIRTIARNVARSARRVKSLSVDPDRVSEDIEENALLVPDALSLREEARRVLECALSLPASLREPLLLRAIEGLSQAAIAAALGLTESAVEARLARARARLRSLATRTSTRESPPADPSRKDPSAPKLRVLPIPPAPSATIWPRTHDERSG